MGGRFLVPLSAEHRESAGLAAGDHMAVDIEADTAPREVTMRLDLDAAMDDLARAAYDGLSFTYRKGWVRWVEDAKKPETRAIGSSRPWPHSAKESEPADRPRTTLG
jgi:hypothetical protein